MEVTIKELRRKNDLMEEKYNMDNVQEALNRAKTLLKAAGKLLKKQENAYYVLNLLEETVYYDGAECDGLCLLDDIRYWFDEFATENIDEENE